MSNKPIIEIHNLHKSYGKEEILKGVNLDVFEGQVLTIIGGSGCGKTTLLRCLNCLEVFDTGFLRVADIALVRNYSSDDLAKQSNGTIDLNTLGDKSLRETIYRLRAEVGMLFQSFNLFPHLSVLENVALAPIQVKKMQKQDAVKLAEKMLNKVGMISYSARKPFQLSGGQSQRVAIARALAMNPKVMLYDEPTSALDLNLTQEVLEVMKNLYTDGITQIIVTHDINFARNVSNFVAYMEDGAIIEKHTPNEFFDNPQDDRTRKYLSLTL